MKGAKLGLSGVVALASVHLAALGHHAPTPYHTELKWRVPDREQ